MYAEAGSVCGILDHESAGTGRRITRFERVSRRRTNTDQIDDTIYLSSCQDQMVGGAAAKCSNQTDLHLDVHRPNLIFSPAPATFIDLHAAS